MKKILKVSTHAFVTLAFMNAISLGTELPEEAQRLIASRKKTIETIDKKFVYELDKIKTNYTKKGDLDSANAILDLIKTVPLPVEIDVLVGNWLFTSGNWKGARELRDNGICYVDGKQLGTWNRTGQHLVIVFEGSTDTFLLPMKDGKLEGRSSKGWKVQAHKIKYIP